MKSFSIIFFFMVLPSISYSQNESTNLTKEIQFDALDENDESVKVSLTYIFSIDKVISNDCPYKTIVEIEYNIVIPEIRSYLRYEFSKLDKSKVMKYEFESLTEINKAINRGFILNSEKKLCKVNLTSIEIDEVKY